MTELINSGSILLKSIAKGPNGLDVAKLLKFTAQLVVVDLTRLRIT
jgi:hypothetical protein